MANPYLQQWDLITGAAAPDGSAAAPRPPGDALGPMGPELQAQPGPARTPADTWLPWVLLGLLGLAAGVAWSRGGK